MKKLTNLEKFGLIAAIVVAGSYFYMQRVYDPEAERLKRTIDKLNKTIASYNNVQETPPTGPLKGQIGKEKKVLEALNVKLKDEGGRTGEESEVMEVLQKINSQADEQQVRINKIQPGDDLDEGLFTWKVFKLELHGRYSQVVNFIGRLKEMKEPVQMRNIEIKKDVNENGAILVTLTLLV